jgi:hypothetical protein
MNLWGVAPLFAVALLGSAHGAAANHAIRRDAAQSTSFVSAAIKNPRRGKSSLPPSPTPSAVPAAGAPTPVLRQTALSTWTTVVLVSDNTPSCDTAKNAYYWLVTTSPSGTSQAMKPQPTPTVVGTATPGQGISCQVTLTFTKVAQTPQTATLVVNENGASSSVALVVSRDVTLDFYLLLPALTGAGTAAVLFVLSLLLVRVYGWDGRKLRWRHGDWWRRPIVGSGAWTLNDSWATNISTGLVVVGTVLTITSAANSLFPGIALDRFAIVFVVAGAIVVAAPVVFGIGYVLLTMRNRGPTADAAIGLPRDATVTVDLPSGATITMSGDATVQETAGSPVQARVRAGCAYQVPPGASIGIRPAAAAVLAALVRDVELAVVAAAVAQPTARVAANAMAQQVTALAAARDDGRAAKWDDGRAAARAVALAAARGAVGDPAGGNVEAPAREAAREAVRVIMAAYPQDAATITSAAGQMPDQAGAWASAPSFLRKAEQEAVREGNKAVRAALRRRKVARVVKRTARTAVVEAVTRAITLEVPLAVAQAVKERAEQVADGTGAGVAADGTGAGAAELDVVLRQAVAETLTFPGTSDIGVRPGTILLISAPAGALTIQGSDQLTPSSADRDNAPTPWWRHRTASPAKKPDDVRITYPARVEAPGGAKITVTGTADVSFPVGTTITAPRSRNYPVRQERKFLEPQGSNVLVASMGLLMLANIVTTFGIGAELGVAFSLAYYSEAAGLWRGLIFAGLGAVLVLLITYAITATDAMADPQPGSSISAQTGTSFTL